MAKINNIVKLGEVKGASMKPAPSTPKANIASPPAAIPKITKPQSSKEK